VTEALALTLAPGTEWRHIGSAPEAKPIELVVRSFDRPVLFAAGTGSNRPDGEPVEVGAGQGARLEGMHFFARPTPGPGPARILVRGLESAPD
jgi:hypothetical protein